MKNLKELKKEQAAKIDALVTSCLVFFAFSDEQFHKNKTQLLEGEKYVSIGAGGYLPKSQVDNWINGLKEITKWFKNEVKNNKLRDKQILYELCNHECFYTGEIDEALESLGADYSFEEVQTVYLREREKQVCNF